LFIVAHRSLGNRCRVLRPANHAILALALRVSERVVGAAENAIGFDIVLILGGADTVLTGMGTAPLATDGPCPAIEARMRSVTSNEASRGASDMITNELLPTPASRRANQQALESEI
jgi:hypothetical protein